MSRFNLGIITLTMGALCMLAGMWMGIEPFAIGAILYGIGLAIMLTLTED